MFSVPGRPRLDVLMHSYLSTNLGGLDLGPRGYMDLIRYFLKNFKTDSFLLPPIPLYHVVIYYYSLFPIPYF